MKWTAILLAVAATLVLTSGCANSPAVSSTPLRASKSQSALRMMVYLQTFKDGKIPPPRERLCYIVEDGAFIAELNQRAGTSSFEQLTPMLLRRMEKGVSQRPGLCLLMRFHEVSANSAEGEIFFSLPAPENGRGEVHGFKIEERKGVWTLCWTTVNFL